MYPSTDKYRMNIGKRKRIGKEWNEEEGKIEYCKGGIEEGIEEEKEEKSIEEEREEKSIVYNIR